MAALAQVPDQLAGPPDRLDLADHAGVGVLLGLTDRAAEPTLDLLVRQRRHKLIATHADVTVDAPDRQHEIVRAKRAIPRERVLVVGVDERPVEIEDAEAQGPTKPALAGLIAPGARAAAAARPIR